MKKPTAQRRQGRIRAAVTALFGGDGVSVSDVSGMATVLGSDSATGVTISPRTMLQISAVWACVRLIAETIATLPLSIYERTGASGKRLAQQHPLYSVLHDVPNSDATAAVFWEAMISAMLLRGAGRAEKLIFNGRLVGLVFLNPDRLTPHKRQGNVVQEWHYTDDNGTRRIILAARVWTIPGFSLDGKNGVSVVQYGSAVFGQAIAADKAAGKVFRNGALQNIYYTFKEFLKQEKRDEFRENIMGLLQNGQTPLLEGGIDVKALSINPKDVQLLESRGWSVEEICRWFRTPPWMVGHTEKSTSWGTGIEQQMIGFLTFTLAPWLRRIEQAISKDLLTPAERTRYYPKFAVEGLLRADSAGRAAFYGVMVDKGIYTRDQVRELEDQEPMGGNAAVLTVQSAMTTLDSIGQASTTDQQARASIRAWLGLSNETEPQKG
jgi:HK97 family phage portal protein